MRLLTATLMLGTVLGSTPAYAQRATERDTGSNIPVPKRASIPDRGAQVERGAIVMREFARCTIDRSPAKVATLLAMPLGGAYNKMVAQVSSEECLSSGEISFKPVLLRGALFIELWRRRTLAVGKGKPWGPVLPAFDLNAPIDDDTNQATKQLQGLLWFGDCIVKRDPVASSDVVVNPVGSRAQDEAYARLLPDLGPCLPQGQQVKFSRPVLEGVLAEALYRAPLDVKVEAGTK